MSKITTLRLFYDISYIKTMIFYGCALHSPARTENFRSHAEAIISRPIGETLFVKIKIAYIFARGATAGYSQRNNKNSERFCCQK